MIAYEIQRWSGGAQIMWVPSSGGEGQPLTEGSSSTEHHRAPDWSPDGTQIAFSSNRGGSSYDVWTAAFPSGSLSRITASPAGEGMPVWSPDGTKFAYYGDESGNYDIWVVSASGGSPTQVTDDPGTDMMPTWSPDGTRLAFISDRSGSQEVWIVTLATGALVQVTATPDQEESGPDWSPDGREIAYHMTFWSGGIWVIPVP
jgi:TolB protein